MGFVQRDPQIILYILISFVIAVSIHEFMHAWTAWRLGDDTALRLGRVTLNPIMHFEPIGFIGMLLIAVGFPAIGWGKPVPVNTSRLRATFRGRPIGMAIVAIAGPVSNVVQAAVVAIPFWVLPGTVGSPALREFALWFININLLLAAFNMIPVPPLDGSRILFGFLPRFWQPFMLSLERYGIAVIFLLFIVGRSLGGTSITSEMYRPVYDLLASIVTNDFRF